MGFMIRKGRKVPISVYRFLVCREVNLTCGFVNVYVEVRVG